MPNPSYCKPSYGSVLIYKKTKEMIYGHVAIITGVADDYILVSEENWDNENYWPGNYSRKVSMMFKENQYFLIDESVILG